MTVTATIDVLEHDLLDIVQSYADQQAMPDEASLDRAHATVEHAIRELRAMKCELSHHHALHKKLEPLVKARRTSHRYSGIGDDLADAYITALDERK